VRRGTLSSSWLWLLSLFTLAGFIETVFWGQMNSFTPLYLPRLGIAPGDVATWTGATVAISGALGIPFLPFWGALADRYSRKPVIVRSFVAHLVAGVIALLAGNIWVFVLGRAVMSLALGNSGLMMTTLEERVPEGRRGLAFTIMNSAPPVGAFIGPLIGGPIVDARGFPALLAIDVALMIGVILMLTFGYHDDFQGRNTGPLARMAAESVRVVWESRRLRTLFPALFLLFGGWMVALTYVPLATQALYTGATPGTAVGLVIGAGGLTALVLGPATGLLADRFGHWRVLFCGAALEVVLWPLPALMHNIVAFGIAWAVLNGVASGVFALSFSVLSASAAAAIRARVLSFAYLPVNAGLFVGPALGSIVTRASLFAVFPVAAALTLLGVAALAFAARQPMPQSQAPVAVHV